MDVGPRRKIVQDILFGALSRIRKFGDLEETAFARNVRDLSTNLREWAVQFDDPTAIDSQPEMPGLESYTLWADSYDNVAYNPVIAAEEEILYRLIGNVTGLRVLDVGCGTGRHAVHLAQGGATMLGLEPTPEMLERAEQKAIDHNLNLDFRLGSIEDLDPNLGDFDLVLCCLVLSHIENLESAIEKMTPHIVPGGRLIITDVHPLNILMGFRTTFVKNKQKYVVPNFPHLPSRYFRALRRQGLNVTGLYEQGYDENLPGLPITLVIIAEKSL